MESTHPSKETAKPEVNTDTTEKDERKKQQQSDPQITELKGFTDPDEDLEPKLENDKDDEK